MVRFSSITLSKIYEPAMSEVSHLRSVRAIDYPGCAGHWGLRTLDPKSRRAHAEARGPHPASINSRDRDVITASSRDRFCIYRPHRPDSPHSR